MIIYRIVGLSAMAMLAFSGVAAAETIAYSSGGFFAAPPAGTSVETFDSLTLGSTLSNYSDTFATFTGTGIIADPSTSVPHNSNTAEPYPDQTQYLSVQGNQSETITFGAFKPTTFGIYWGSIDTYNQVVLNFVGGSQTYTGPDVPPPANGNQSASDTNGYVTWTGSALLSVVLSSGQNAFELDNVFINSPTGGGNFDPTTPLPSAVVLFASALAAGGLLMRRRRSNSTAQEA